MKMVSAKSVVEYVRELKKEVTFGMVLKFAIFITLLAFMGYAVVQMAALFPGAEVSDRARETASTNLAVWAVCVVAVVLFLAFFLPAFAGIARDLDKLKGSIAANDDSDGKQ